MQKAIDEKPDIVITGTDLGPGIDGFETCQQISEIEGLDAKIIVCTGRIDTIDAGKAREAGAEDYCVKTSKNDQLIGTVKNLIAERT